MSEQLAIPAVRREVTVRATVAHAFTVFTERIATWWPHETHQVGPTPADAVIEPFEGGRCLSRSADGAESPWGRVMAWEPPDRLVLAWLLNPDWEYEPDPARASEVEVRFIDAGDGRTRVELEHRCFERYATGGEGMRDEVDGAGGWGALMDLYAGALGKEAA